MYGAPSPPRCGSTAKHGHRQCFRTFRGCQRSIRMTSTIFLFYAAAHLGLFSWALFLLLRYRRPSTVPLLIVTFGLVYDNSILAAGSTLNHGDLLERLSVPRYFMHAFGTPLLMLSGLAFARRAGAKWAQHRFVAAGVALLTLGMVAVGVDADLFRLQLYAKEAAGVVSYGNAGSQGPPVAPIVTILVLIAAGWAVWRYQGGYWLLAGAVAQFVAAAIGDAIVIAGNLGELALLAGLVMTDSGLSRSDSHKVRRQ